MATRDDKDAGTGLSRREVLRLGAGAALLMPLGLGCSPSDKAPPVTEGACDADGEPADGATPLTTDPASVLEDAALFALGVQAGAVRSDSALLWTHAQDGAPKVLKVWRERADGTRVLAKESMVTPQDGYAKAEITGLAANTRYSYAFFTPEGTTAARSTVGTFRTAYDGDCRRPLTIAATACTRASYRPFKSLQVAAKHDFDVFCQLGDMTYNDSATTQEEYRSRWRATLNDPGYRAVLGKASSLITWDDHEFTESSVLYEQPEARIQMALDAFYETLPVRRGPNDRLWNSYRWGESVEFFVLDCRLERQPETRLTDHPIYISREQLDWLQQGLKASKAHFKVILNSVPMIDWNEDYWLIESDRWEGYRKQREELLAFITGQGIRNVWFLSGDFHVGAVARVDRQGPARNIWEILVGPGGNKSVFEALYMQGTPDEKEAMAPADQFRHLGFQIAATLITFDPLTDSVRVRFIDAATEEVVFDQALRASD